MNLCKIIIDRLDPSKDRLVTHEISEAYGYGINATEIERLEVDAWEAFAKDVGLYRIHEFNRCHVHKAKRTLLAMHAHGVISYTVKYENIRVRPQEGVGFGKYNLIVEDGWVIRKYSITSQSRTSSKLFWDDHSRRHIIEVSFRDEHNPPMRVSFVINVSVARDILPSEGRQTATKLDNIDYWTNHFNDENGRIEISLGTAIALVKEIEDHGKGGTRREICGEILSQYSIYDKGTRYDADHLANSVAKARARQYRPRSKTRQPKV